MASSRQASSRRKTGRQPSNLRIIGGKYRGRLIQYHGDPSTRPMKERVREAVFNLVGPAVKEKLVVDLFAGTGAMALEALSRGAQRAIVIERSFPSAAVIRQNSESLGLVEKLIVATADTFVWVRRHPLPTEVPLLVFCCPPYDYYLSKAEQMDQLIRLMIRTAPAGSVIVVECDQRFETDSLPQADSWDVRTYSPAVVCVFDVTAES